MFWDKEKCEIRKLAAVDEDVELTYGKLYEIEEEIVGVLEKKCVILFLSENTIGSFVGYYSLIDAECAVILLESNINEEYCYKMLELYHPAYVWCNEEWSARLGYNKVYSKYNFNMLKTEYAPYDIFGDVALILTTSGSTGSAKCVSLSRAALRAHAKALPEALGFRTEDSFITTMPMAFVQTLSFINFHVFYGATIIFSKRSVMEKEFWKLFDKYKPTCFTGLDIHYRMLELIHFFDKNCEHMRIYSQGGDVFSEKIKMKVKEYCQTYGKEIFGIYGQTETSGTCASFSLLEDPGNKCIGKATASGKLYIEDINEHGEGELVYRGLCQMNGYVSNAADIKNGVEKPEKIYTGDIVRQDENGFYIIGRKKRIIKIANHRTSLDDIENMIKKEAEITECACIGLDEKLHIFCIEEDINKKEKVLEILKVNLKVRESDVYFKYIKQIFRNESGKVMYHKLYKILQETEK